MLLNTHSLSHLLPSGRTLSILAITLVLTVNSLPHPAVREGSGGIIRPRQEIKLDTLSHAIHISTELHTTSSHNAPNATPVNSVFCFLTVPPQLCQLLYISRML